MSQDVPMTQEVLSAGSPRARSGPAHFWPVAIVFVVVFSLIATAAVVAFGVRTLQAERLLAAVESSERAMGSAQEALTAALEGFEDPDLTPADRAVLVEELQSAASSGAKAIERTGVQVADVRVAAWNTRVADAQTVYLEHNVAWVNYLTAVSQDPTELARPQPAINATFFDARTPLWQSVPAIDLLNLRDRISAMYADSGANGGGTAT